MCAVMRPAKPAEPIDTLCGLRTRAGPGNRALCGGSDSPRARNNFHQCSRKRVQQLKKLKKSCFFEI